MNAPKLFLLILISISYLTTAQVKRPAQTVIPSTTSKHGNTEIHSPGGLLDNLYDRFGNKYSLTDLYIYQPPGSESRSTNSNSLVSMPATTFTSCNSGYFRLY